MHAIINAVSQNCNLAWVSRVGNLGSRNMVREENFGKKCGINYINYVENCGYFSELLWLSWQCYDSHEWQITS